MHALVLIAHGSRRQASNQEVKDLAQRLQQHSPDRFQLIETGFLELAEPSIPEAIESCIHAGATSVVVVPYFLAAGRHVAEDIPNIMQPVAQRHRHVDIHISGHIGMADAMTQLILDAAGGIATRVLPDNLQKTA